MSLLDAECDKRLIVGSAVRVYRAKVVQNDLGKIRWRTREVRRERVGHDKLACKCFKSLAGKVVTLTFASWLR